MCQSKTSFWRVWNHKKISLNSCKVALRCARILSKKITCGAFLWRFCEASAFAAGVHLQLECQIFARKAARAHRSTQHEVSLGGVTTKINQARSYTIYAAGLSTLTTVRSTLRFAYWVLTSEELIRRGEKIAAHSKAIEFRGLVGASGYATNHIDSVATTEVIGRKSATGETATQHHTNTLDYIMKAVDRRKCGVKLVGVKSYYIHFTGKEAMDREEFTAKVEIPVLIMLSRHLKLWHATDEMFSGYTCKQERCKVRGRRALCAYQEG